MAKETIHSERPAQNPVIPPEISLPKGTNVPSVWQVLADAAGTVDAPPDWASQHDHYLYGAPKREQPDAA